MLLDRCEAGLKPPQSVQEARQNGNTTIDPPDSRQRLLSDVGRFQAAQKVSLRVSPTNTTQKVSPKAGRNSFLIKSL